MANIMSTDPGYDAAAVTPSDTTHLGNVRALYIGGAGDVRIDTEGGSTVTFVGVQAGSILPVRAARVYSTSTTATSIVAIY
jgi:hypothetical protein